jgi:hypothetical protein
MVMAVKWSVTYMRGAALTIALTNILYGAGLIRQYFFDYRGLLHHALQRIDWLSEVEIGATILSLGCCMLLAVFLDSIRLRRIIGMLCSFMYVFLASTFIQEVPQSAVWGLFLGLALGSGLVFISDEEIVR